MSTETRADFARRLGVNRSSVTRWAETGRIVMDGDRVDVEASLQRLRETGGARPDVAERHAAARGAPVGEKVGAGDMAPPPAAASAPPPAAASAPPAADPGDRIGNSYQAARAVKEKYAALSSKLDYERAMANLIPKEDVDAALRTFAAAVRARLDVMPDQMAPVLAPTTDLDDVHAILAEHLRHALTGIADDMHRAEATLGAPPT